MIAAKRAKQTIWMLVMDDNRIIMIMIINVNGFVSVYATLTQEDFAGFMEYNR
jgi:hypothetical protein